MIHLPVHVFSVTHAGRMDQNKIGELGKTTYADENMMHNMIIIIMAMIKLMMIIDCI